jgi:hypothetical protein
LIDNSSRLRSLASDPSIHIRLPVTLKPQNDPIEAESTPPHSGYILPGPPHIYAPNQLQTAATKPPVLYLPPTTPPNTYLPPVMPEDPMPPVSPPLTTATETEPPITEAETDPPMTPPEIINEIIPNPETKPPATANETCSEGKCCEVTEPGKFVIPIPLKNTGCCKKFAQLILPVKGFDEELIQKLTNAITQEIDGTKLLADIFSNLVK